MNAARSPALRRLLGLALAACVPLVFTEAAMAADKPGSKDFASISRFRGAEIVEYQPTGFDEAALPVQPIAADTAPAASLLRLEGQLTRIKYRLPPDKTALEAMRNYEQALGDGYKTVFKCAGAACGRNLAGYMADKVIPTGWPATFDTDKNRYLLVQRSTPGGDVYVLVYVMQETNYPATVYQETVEMKPMQGAQVTVLDAAALKRGLDAEGRVAVYGVYFDTAKAEVKPESKASLDEMAKLLAASRSLKVYIVGHTDNAGTLAGNLDLSQRRAEAVAKALATTYRIDPQRLVARGVASLSPVASNAEEAGRARNRRVELVVQ